MLTLVKIMEVQGDKQIQRVSEHWGKMWCKKYFSLCLTWRLSMAQMNESLKKCVY